jgi:putative PIN family toxin of toxin-antitoxin system
MRIVLDTNVLVSGLLRPHGPPGRILDAIVAGAIGLLVDDRILREYVEVLTRPRFGFDRAVALQLVELLAASADHVDASGVAVTLPDPDDAPFLEVAIAGGADALVTGNARHFKSRDRRAGVQILEPSTFLAARGTRGRA